MIANMTALTAALVAIPVLTGLQTMKTVNGAQLPGDCTLQHVEYLDSEGKLQLSDFRTYQCPGAVLGVIKDGTANAESGK